MEGKKERRGRKAHTKTQRPLGKSKDDLHNGAKGRREESSHEDTKT